MDLLIEKKLPDNQIGLVVSYYGQMITIETATGTLIQCQLRRNQTLPVVGDYVHWQLEGEYGIISEIVPRRSLLARLGKKGEMQAIAANIDYLAIVMSPPPVWSYYLVDRYLIAAHLLKINPLIVVNKIDLLDTKQAKLLKKELENYIQIGYPVIFSSVYQHQGLSKLSTTLAAKTTVLVGPSGVGKSSIIAKLTQNLAIPIAPTTAKGSGKHTTTATRLYHLASSGALIDSPGVREFNLWAIVKEELIQSFVEFAPFIKNCKFKDCMHLVEPHCAVIAAVNTGKISQTRYANFQTLMKQIMK